jgi:hypothetical protein
MPPLLRQFSFEKVEKTNQCMNCEPPKHAIIAMVILCSLALAIIAMTEILLKAFK